MTLAIVAAIGFIAGFFTGKIRSIVRLKRHAVQWFDQLDIDEQHEIVGALQHKPTVFSSALLRMISAKQP